ncbi:protein of unknown function [Thermomonospora echinospora]|uniref:DUF4259 domain-containing protein n=1 Tax=Thermomonospora echinospora TaxID=1992 RepID=A0A1H6D1D1_9ACTN|nr:DUF4259 domain-containing protein [Thermomonospora echinospora]SEG79027.1 protein of unknown function [Thermomonospora echinospora]
MGTWGPGPFDDDTAMDFVDYLLDLPPDQVQQELRTAVRLACDVGGYLGYVDAVRAVAAASLLAGVVPPGYESSWTVPLRLTPDLAAEAMEAIGRAHSAGSDLHELRAESGTYARVDEALRPVLAALQRGAHPVDLGQESLF